MTGATRNQDGDQDLCLHGHVTHALAQQSVSGAGSPRGARRGLTVGVIVGVVATLLLVSVAWAAKQVLSSDARTFTTTCRGATVTGTIWVDDSGVFTSVAVVDPNKRNWDIKWGDYAEEVAGSTMSRSSPDYTGSLVSSTQMLGDTDDGTHRTAQVRPHGQSSWCATNMHVYWFW